MNKKFAIVLALSLIAIVCCAGCIDPQDPVDPVDPVVPVDPVDPVTPPVEPVVPAEEYSVFFMLNYDGAGAYSAETVTAGDAVSKPATPTRSGYTFKGWFTAAEGGAEYDFTQAVNADLTLYAQWSKKSSSSSSSGSSHTHSYTEVVTAPTCTEDGYTTYSCSAGDHSYTGNPVPKLGHELELVTENGVTYKNCTRCDYSETVPAGVTYVAQIGNNFYTEFSSAVNAASDEDVIVLLAETTENINKKVSIDVNGQTATLTYTDGNYIKILGDATVKLSNGMIVALEEVEGYNVAKSASGDNALYIYTITGLKEFSDEVNDGESYSGSTVTLMKEIDLNNEDWTPIGQFKKDTYDTRFKGTFDGNGMTIKNLKIVQNNPDNSTGFFGTLDGVVKNLNIDVADISGISDGAGVVAGKIYNFGTIENCKVTNAKVSSNHYVGGIVGSIYGSVKNCVVDTIELTATPNAIGDDSFDNGDKIGGIVGFMQNDNAEANVISGNDAKNVKISAYRDAGGIVGAAPANGHVTGNSVNILTIDIDQATYFYEQKDANAAGIVGRVLSGTVYNSNTESGVTITYKGNFVKVEETGKIYSSLKDALTAISTDTYGTYTIMVSGEATWETGAGIGSTPLIEEDVDVSAVSKVTIAGDDENAKFVATGSGVGQIRAANGATLVFKDITIIDKSVSYAEDSWEYGYLEFGGILEFDNCNIQNAIMIEGTEATFINGCTFNSNKDSEYAVWVNNGVAEFSGCTFEGTRGLKTHEAYGSEVTSITVDDCTFGPLSKKPGIALGTLNAETTISITDSEFNNCQPGDQKLFIYETDTDISTIVFTCTGNTVNGATVSVESDGSKTYTTSESTSLDNLNSITQNAVGSDTIVLGTNVAGTATDIAPYGNNVGIVIKNGATFDGQGNTLTVTDGSNTYAAMTYGGTIQNLKIDSGVRGIVSYTPTTDVVLNTVYIDGPGYAFNSAEHGAEHGAVKLIVSGSTLNGWTSFAGFTDASFTLCNFGENTKKYWQNVGYSQDYDRLIRPYVTTMFDKCAFENGFYIDLSALADGCKVTLKDCTVDSTEITEENYSTLITIELPSEKTLVDCVIFE